jgi:hypothetical protein
MSNGLQVDLSRRLGFVDEIYWYRKYLLEKNVMVGTPQTQASEP